MKRSRGTMSSYTRKLKSKRVVSASDLIKDFAVGDSVCIDVQPYFKGATPHYRYSGRVGKVVELRGSCFVVEIKDGNLKKKLISHPIHINKQK